ncbi:culC, partial [Symbiodinium microadriaticum]
SELISAHAQTLVDMEHSGCESMFRDNRLQDLAALFRLFSRVPQCLDFLRDAMTKYVKSTGSELIADHDKSREPPVVFAQKLLDLKAKFNDISSTCFQSEPRSVKLLK